MNIQEFINQIPFKILQRGQNYFEDGNIIQLNPGRNGSWYAEVEGNYGNYEVGIEMDNEGNVSNYYCDCPFDGDVCKHIAALALAIDEKNTITISPGQEHHEESWEQLIKDAKLKDLKNFLLDFGLRNQDFRHQVKLVLSKPVSIQNANNIPYYQQQINGIFENYEYQGFIDYHDNYKATRDVSHFLKKAHGYYSKGNLNEAFCISAAIAMEGVSAIQCMDDSSGEYSEMIYESIMIIENIFNSTTSAGLKQKIFNWLYKQVQNSDYRSSSVDSLQPLFFDTAISLKQIDVAHKFIDAKIIQLDKEDDWSKQYYLQDYLGLKVDLLEAEGRIAEAENIIDSYLHFEKFRKVKVAQALSENDPKKAEELILEGIKIAEQDDAPGIVHQWKDQLLDLYKQQKKAHKYNKLAGEMFVENTSSIEYFKIYKQTSPIESWEKRRTKLIAKLKNKKGRYQYGISLDDLAQVYIEEQMVDELFAIVISSNCIHTIIRYTPHLKLKFSAELLEFYNAAIEIEAKQTGRNIYVALVQYLKQMAKLKGGLSAAKALKKSLLNKYKNRPAMKEEFKRLNWH